MSTLQSILGAIAQISLVIFSITLVIMLFTLKRRGYSPEGVHVKHKLDFNLDLGYFADIRKGYKVINEKSLLPILNHISIYIGVLSVAAIFIFAVINESAIY